MTIGDNMKIGLNKAKEGVWHKWFAWHPVKVENHLVWLETIEKCYYNTIVGETLVHYRFPEVEQTFFRE